MLENFNRDFVIVFLCLFHCFVQSCPGLGFTDRSRRFLAVAATAAGVSRLEPTAAVLVGTTIKRELVACLGANLVLVLARFVASAVVEGGHGVGFLWLVFLVHLFSVSFGPTGSCAIGISGIATPEQPSDYAGRRVVLVTAFGRGCAEI